MSQALGVVLFVVVVLLVVLVHEGGHFLAAKSFGIKVHEFFVGFGPRIWSMRRGETEYGVKALPLGGYVRIAGMSPYEEVAEADLPRTYGAKPAWQRAMVILAGPITHFVMAILLLVVFFWLVGVPTKFQPVIAAVDPTLNGHPSPAAVAGLRAGDAIVGVDGIRTPSEQTFVEVTRAHAGRPMTLLVRRGDRTLSLTATPVLSQVGRERVGRLGVAVGGGPVLVREHSNPIVAVGRAGTTTWALLGATVSRLGDVFGPAGITRIVHLLAGAPRRASDPASIVGGAQVAGDAVRAGAWDVLFLLFAQFNVFVGFLNLLPLPPLDGGHLAVIALEKVTRRPIDPRRLVPITALVASFLILFMVSVVYLDIVNPIPNPFR